MTTSRIALVAWIVLSTINFTSASIVGTTLTFTAAQLDGFTVQSSTPQYMINDLGANLPANAVVLAPAYSDGLFPMSGSAGATGMWPKAPFGSSTVVYLGAAFAPTDLSGLGLTALRQVAYNDNDDIWGHDVWIDVTDNATFDPIQSSVVDINGGAVGPPNSALLSLDLTGVDLSTVVGWGVSIHGQLNGGKFPSSGDAFHSSWSAAIPEPATIAVWSLLTLFGSCAVWKTNKNRRDG